MTRYLAVTLMVYMYATAHHTQMEPCSVVEGVGLHMHRVTRTPALPGNIVLQETTLAKCIAGEHWLVMCHSDGELVVKMMKKTQAD